MEILYKPIFIRQFNKLEVNLQEEVFEKIELFKNAKNHKLLKVHKLKGKFEDCYSFSVNYSFRIVFSYDSKTRVQFLSIGDHDVYK
ncbi:type II toxin-antitoxin system RelE/ParE family toxin [Candidatus Nomurabacteria bacterium]|nr:type II toxin-antitoxin system RelE/ParE family toxin [Candidatus Nomurabacteria bacterium]